MSTATPRFSTNGNGHAQQSPNDTLGIPLPHDLDAEKAVLGSMMLDPGVIETVDEVVRGADFHAPENGIIFRTIIGVHITGAVPDATLLHEQLKRQGLLESVGGLAYLLELVDGIPHAANAVHYAEIVREKSIRRQEVRRARDIMLRAVDESEDPFKLRIEAAKAFEDIGNRATTEALFKLTAGPDVLSADHTQSYLVEDILVEGQPCMIGGPSKSLKTTLAIDLFIALTVGGMFLGKFRVTRRCRTLLMSGESGAATIAETMRRILDAAGRSPDELDGFSLCTKLPQLADMEHLTQLGRVLKQNAIDVLAIDPIYLCMPSEGVANLFAQGEALGRIAEVCASHNVTPILLHHVKRPAATTYEPIELTDLAFSGYAEWARQWLLVGRREKYLPGSGDHRLWFTVGGSAGHNSLWAIDANEGTYTPGAARYWDVTVRPPDDVRKDEHKQQAEAKAAKRKEKATEELEHAKREVCRYLAKRPAGDTYRGIREGVPVAERLTKLAIQALLDDGAIVEVEVVKNNRSETGYALKTEDKSNG